MKKVQWNSFLVGGNMVLFAVGVLTGSYFVMIVCGLGATVSYMGIPR